MRRVGVVGLGVVMALCARVALAIDPVTAFIPQTKTALDAEIKLSTKGTSMVMGVVKCHHLTLNDAAKGKAYDATKLQTCLGKAKDKWLKGVTGLVPRDRGDRDAVALPNALQQVGGATGAFDDMDLQLKRARGKLYCCGSTPLPGDFSGKVPDPSSDPTCTAKNLDKAGKVLQKYSSDLLKCYQNLLKNAFNGVVFSLDDCKAKAAATFDKKLAKIKSIPVCAKAALARDRGARDDIGGLLGDIDDVMATGSDQAAPPETQSSPPVYDFGCCQSGTGSALMCRDYSSAAGTTCSGLGLAAFTHTTCDSADGSCGTTVDRCIGGVCPPGRDPSNCQFCPTPTPLPTGVPTPTFTPAPFCGDGICNGAETCQCPDCPPCVCGDGFRSGSAFGEQPGDEDCDVGVGCPTISVGSGVTVTGACNLSNCKCEFNQGATVNPPGTTTSTVCSHGLGCTAVNQKSTCPGNETCVQGPNGLVCVNMNITTNCFNTGGCCVVNSDCEHDAAVFEYCAAVPHP